MPIGKQFLLRRHDPFLQNFGGKFYFLCVIYAQILQYRSLLIKFLSVLGCAPYFIYNFSEFELYREFKL